MIRAKAQLPEHLIDDLRAHRDHDDFTLIEHRLIAVSHTHVGVSGRKRARYSGIPRRQHNRDISLGGTETVNDRASDRAGPDKPQPHASRPFTLATPYPLRHAERYRSRSSIASVTVRLANFSPETSLV